MLHFSFSSRQSYNKSNKKAMRRKPQPHEIRSYLWNYFEKQDLMRKWRQIPVFLISRKFFKTAGLGFDFAPREIPEEKERGSGAFLGFPRFLTGYKILKTSRLGIGFVVIKYLRASLGIIPFSIVRGLGRSRLYVVPLFV